LGKAESPLGTPGKSLIYFYPPELVPPNASPYAIRI
jgi:hypothetical protein